MIKAIYVPSPSGAQGLRDRDRDRGLAVRLRQNSR